MTPYNSDLERGLHNRRHLLGDAWVDQSLAGATEFTADFQNFITRFAWHEIWSRPGLDAKTRRIIVLVITAATGRWDEYELHLQAAFKARHDEASHGGLSPDEIKEVLLQTAVYAGVPTANTAMAKTRKVMQLLDMPQAAASVFNAAQAGQGQPFRTASSPALHYTVRECLQHRRHQQTVVLSHALGADSSMWDALASDLCRDFRVICYDHRGHGLSEASPGPYTMQALAEDAQQLLQELEQKLSTGPVIWIGLSLGGMVGQELALRYPAMLKALVIANSTSSYGTEGREQWRQRIAAVESQGLDGVADGTMQRWFSAAYHAAHPARVARWRRRLVSTPLAGYLSACHAVMNMDTTDRLPNISTPTLVIAGGQDQGTPLAMSQTMAKAISSAELVVMQQAAHLSVLEDAPEFAMLVHRFIDRFLPDDQGN
jgi:3-oxoadipate enol-lactonase